MPIGVPIRPNVIGKADPAVDFALGYLHDRIRLVEVRTEHVDQFLTKKQADALYSAPVLREQLESGGSSFINLSNLPGQSAEIALHNILSSTHPDTLTDSVVRGDLIFGNATPLWARLALGAVANYLRSNGTDAGWSTLLAGDLSGIVAVANGGTGIASGTSGGILGYTATGTLASSVLLTANAIVLGGGVGATPTPLGSLGTTVTVLHGNAAGAPSFAAVSLTTDVSGILPYANAGTNASIAWTAGSLIFAGASSFAQDNANLFWDNTNKRLGVGLSSPNVGLDVAQAIITRRLTVTLVNGANNDIAISTTGYMGIAGPTAAFSISGFANGFDGRILRVTSEVAQTMTITNLAGSVVGNQIITGTGANVVLSTIQGVTLEFIYDTNLSKWCLVRST